MAAIATCTRETVSIGKVSKHDTFLAKCGSLLYTSTHQVISKLSWYVASSIASPFTLDVSEKMGIPVHENIVRRNMGTHYGRATFGFWCCAK